MRDLMAKNYIISKLFGYFGWILPRIIRIFTQDVSHEGPKAHDHVEAINSVCTGSLANHFEKVRKNRRNSKDLILFIDSDRTVGLPTNTGRVG